MQTDYFIVGNKYQAEGIAYATGEKYFKKEINGRMRYSFRKTEEVVYIGTLLYNMNACPFRLISFNIASLTNISLYSITYVWTGYLFCGADSIKDKSPIPTKDICNDLGIGVAETERT